MPRRECLHFSFTNCLILQARIIKRESAANQKPAVALSDSYLFVEYNHG
jgi:hypothetical protein